MSSSEGKNKELSVEQPVSSSDDELAAFMKKHTSHDGTYTMPVGGWDKLPQTQRKDVAERFIAKKGDPRNDSGLNARTPHLDKPDTLAVEAAAKVERSRVEERRKHRQTVTADELGDPFECETKAYNELVSAGGRPLYPIELLQEVSRNPEHHREMLEPGISLPWRGMGDPQTGWIFSKQLHRWTDFQKWQLDNRGFDDDDGGYEGFVEKYQENIRSSGSKEAYKKMMAQFEANPMRLEKMWEHKKQARMRQRHHNRELGCDGFTEYEEAVQKRLARHDFTKRVCLKLSPKDQDEVTTWIEYLNFEYWWLDKCHASMDREIRVRDRAWEQLVGTGLVLPHETSESLRTPESATADKNAKAAAKREMYKAAAEGRVVADITEEHSNRIEITQEGKEKMRRDAIDKIKEAREKYRSFSKKEEARLDFESKIQGFERADLDLKRQEKVIAWVLQQLRLIESEKKDPSQPAVNSSARRPRKHSVDDDESAENNGKRQKQKRAKFVRFSESITRALIMDEGGRKEEIKTKAGASNLGPGVQAAGSLSLVEPQETQKRGQQCQALRRSARIAARLSQLSSGREHSDAAEGLSRAAKKVNPPQLRRSARIAARQRNLDLARTI